MAKEFVDGIVVKKGPKDFVVARLGFRATEFADFLIKKKAHIENNKSDPNKLYASFDDWTPNKVEASDHSPDREDTPF